MENVLLLVVTSEVDDNDVVGCVHVTQCRNTLKLIKMQRGSPFLVSRSDLHSKRISGIDSRRVRAVEEVLMDTETLSGWT